MADIDHTLAHEEEMQERRIVGERPEPKFKKGQIVVLTSIKKQMPFRILFVGWGMGEWFYGFGPKDAVAESSIRKVTPEEVG